MRRREFPASIDPQRAPPGIEAVSKVKLNQDNRGGSAVSHDGWP